MIEGVPADYVLYGVSLGLSLLLAALSALGGPARALGGHGHGHGLGRWLGRGHSHTPGHGHGHGLGRWLGRGHGQRPTAPPRLGSRGAAPRASGSHGSHTSSPTQSHTPQHAHGRAAPGPEQLAHQATGTPTLPGYSLSNPIAFMAFLGGFGAFGFIARGAGASLALGLVIALVAGWALSALLFQLFVRLVLASEGSTQHVTEDAIGKLGTITVPIPANGLGAVAYVVAGKRQTLAARQQDGGPLKAGSEVVIVDLERQVAIVRTFARRSRHDPQGETS